MTPLPEGLDTWKNDFSFHCCFSQSPEKVEHISLDLQRELFAPMRPSGLIHIWSGREGLIFSHPGGTFYFKVNMLMKAWSPGNIPPPAPTSSCRCTSLGGLTPPLPVLESQGHRCCWTSSTVGFFQTCSLSIAHSHSSFWTLGKADGWLDYGALGRRSPGLIVSMITTTTMTVPDTMSYTFHLSPNLHVSLFCRQGKWNWNGQAAQNHTAASISWAT